MSKKLTIVGPEPTVARKTEVQKKTNVEALLLMAKYDKDFRKKLFEDREKALADSGLDLSRGERMIFANISNDQLEANIEEFQVPGITKKSLPTWTKAAAVILILATTSLACKTFDDPGPIRGTDPDSFGNTPDQTVQVRSEKK